MKIELTTQLVPFINVNMYNSELDSSYVLEDEFEENSDNFNNTEYEKFIFKCATEIFNEYYLPKLETSNLNITDGRCISIHSPKSYNYGGDELYFDIVINGNIKHIWYKYKSSLLNNGNNFNEYMKETFKSRDGFISSMPQSISDMDTFITEDTERAIAAILNYELSMDETDYQYLLLEKVNNDKYSYDFFNSVVQEKLILKFKDFIK